MAHALGGEDSRTAILHLAAQADLDGPGTDTLDWFRTLDGERWAASLITTQPSPNRLLPKVERHAAEVWDLPDLMPGAAYPAFVLGFVKSRRVRVVHITGSRLGFDLLPDLARLGEGVSVVVRLHPEERDGWGAVSYVARRYGSLVDAFSVTSEHLADTVAEHGIPRSKIEVIPVGVAAVEELEPAVAGQHDHGGHLPAGLSPWDTTRRHDALYERLLARPQRTVATEAGPPPDPPPEPAPLFPRNPPPERTVGVIVPCHRHGPYLDECIRSIKAQTLQPSRVVVVDDGSDDPETVEALDRLDDDPAIEVLRQGENLGPSAARNRALAELDTSYVLPLDADDILLPDALERMVAQLEVADPDVGFVYPNAQHTGNRSDYVPSPAYNLWLLMGDNYCPAPALFDRRAFELGASYPTDMVLGHEDWDLLLQLAELGVHGEHADGPTFLYRKYGFSRISAVEYDPDEFREAVERRHPRLYRNRDEIKRRWAPSVSVVLLDDEHRPWARENLAGLPAQSCGDWELVAGAALAPGVRAAVDAADAAANGHGNAPAGPAAARLQACLHAACGRWVCVLEPRALSALRDPSLIERLIYCFWMHESVSGVVLACAPNVERGAFAQLTDAERLDAEPVAFAFERVAEQPSPEVELGLTGSLLGNLVVNVQAHGPIQWRLLPDAPGASSSAGGRNGNGRVAGPTGRGAGVLSLDRGVPPDRAEAWVQRAISWQEPRAPGLERGLVRRKGASWLPPETVTLCRHRALDREEWLVTTDRTPPPGYRLEFDLGVVHRFPLPGTRRLYAAGETFALTDEQNDLAPGMRPFGYVEQAPLPMLDALELRRMHATGSYVLVAGPDDPLFDHAEPVAALGWIESFPIQPRRTDLHLGPWGVTALRRYVDHEAWRHRYRTGPAGEEAQSVSLGSLLSEPGEALVALRRRADDGRLESELASPSERAAGPGRAARWAVAPLTWGARVPRPLAVRAAGARARRLLRPALHGQRSAAEILGWLRRTPAKGYIPLLSATHPVTRDQLLTHSEIEATDLGYQVDGVLGHIFDAGADRPATLAATEVPWGSRFGRGRRYVEGGRATAPPI